MLLCKLTQFKRLTLVSCVTMSGVYNCGYLIELPGLGDPYSSILDELHTPIDATTIEEDFKRVEDEDGRERLKRCWSAIIDYVRLLRGSRDQAFNERMDALSTLVQSFNVSKYRRCVPDPLPGQSLRAILNDIEVEKQFDVLGPELQKVGEIVGDSRFVCIFCHEVKKKTGDLRVHLIRKHMCNRDEIKQIFDRSKPQGLRVFGQYSYADVCTNRWNIKDWRQRKQRSEGGSEAKRRSETVLKPRAKPCKTSRVSSTNDSLFLVQRKHAEERATQSVGLTRATTTRSPTSPMTQVSPDGYFVTMPNIADDLDLDMPEEPSSMDSSTADLLQQYGTQFQANSSKDLNVMFPDGSTMPADFPASEMYMSPSGSLGPTDPCLPTAPTAFVNFRPPGPLNAYNMFLSGSLRQTRDNYKTSL